MKTEGTGYAVITGAKWIGALLTAQWLGLDKSIQILLYLMGLDFITYLMVATTNKRVSSTNAWNVVAMKAGALIIIFAVHLMTNITADFPLPVDVGAVVGWFYVLTELISIVGNCNALGVPIPAILIDWIDRAKSYQEKKQAAAIEKVKEKAQVAVDTAKQATLSAQETQKAAENLIEAIPVTSKQDDK